MSGKSYDGSLIYDTRISLNNFKKDIQEMKKEAIKSSTDVVSGLNKTTKSIALAAVTLGASVLTMGVKYNSQIEQYTAGFTTMLGSAEKANDLLGNLKNFAASTPFELTDLANASTTLLAFGEDVNSLMPDLKMLGDISLGNSEKFKSLALVFGQVQSQGKLMGQDLLQMINSGFNPLQVISEKTGESMASLKDKMAAGQISFTMVAEAMKTATSEGGQFYNAMQAQSQTLSGQWSTLKDNVTALTGEISADISEKLTTTVLPDLIATVDELSKQWEDGTLQDAIGTTTSVLVAFGVAVAGLNIAVFASDMIKLKQGVEGYTAATKAGAAAQKLMNAELLHNPYVLAGAALTALIAGIVTYAATHKSAVSEIKKSYDDAIEAADKSVAAEKAQAEQAVSLKDRLFELEGQIKSGKLSDEQAAIAKQSFNVVAEQLAEIIPGVTDAIYDENGAIDLQRDKVTALTQDYYNLMTAKAMANAYQEKVDAAAKAKVDVQDEIDSLTDSDKYRVVQTITEWDENDVYAPAKTKTVIVDDTYTSKYQKLLDELAKYDGELEKWQKKQAEELIKIQSAQTETVEEENEERVTSTADAAKDATERASKEFENQYKILKRSLEREKITRADYYKALKSLRDTYFNEGSEEWEKYTDELAEFSEDTFDDCLDALAEFKDKSLNEIEELKNEQQSLKESFLPDKSPIEFGTINGESFVSLANYDKELNQARRYGAMLDELFEKRADLPQSIVNELKSMDTEQGMRYVEALLNSSEEQFNAALQVRQKLEEEAEKNSSKLMSAEAEEMKRILEEKFGELPEDFFNLGDESASAFGNGFLNQLKAAMEVVRATLTAEMSAISNAAVLGFTAAASGANSVVTNNAYNNTYTFNASKDTTTQQLNAARSAAVLERLRGS